MVDGRRGVKAVWPAALTAGFVFAVLQFIMSNYISMQLTDIVASLGSAGALVMFMRVWQPSAPGHGDHDARDGTVRPSPAAAPATPPSSATSAPARPTATARRRAART